MNFDEIIAGIGIAVTLFFGIAGLYDISEFIIKNRGRREKQKEEPMPIPEKITPITKVQGVPENAHPYRSPAMSTKPNPNVAVGYKPPLKVRRVDHKTPSKRFTYPVISINPGNVNQSISIKMNSDAHYLGKIDILPKKQGLSKMS